MSYQIYHLTVSWDLATTWVWTKYQIVKRCVIVHTVSKYLTVLIRSREPARMSRDDDDDDGYNTAAAVSVNNVRQKDNMRMMCDCNRLTCRARWVRMTKTIDLQTTMTEMPQERGANPFSHTTHATNCCSNQRPLHDVCRDSNGRAGAS